MAEVGPSARAGTGRAVVGATVVWGTAVAWAVSWRAAMSAVRAAAWRAVVGMAVATPVAMAAVRAEAERVAVDRV